MGFNSAFKGLKSADEIRRRFIHLAVCLKEGPKPLSNRALHIVRSRASSFKCECPLLSLRSSSSFLRFIPRLPVTSLPPFIFPSITRCRRQLLRRMWPIQLAFRFLISCRIFLCSLTLSGDRGSSVVKVLCYKSEGRLFDPNWCQCIFHWHKILQIALWPQGRLSL